MTFRPKLSFKGLILDIDGVLLTNSTPIGDLRLVFQTLKKKNLLFCLATNNSSKSIQAYQSQFLDFGVDLPKNQIITSGIATAEYLLHSDFANRNLYVIGERGLIEALMDYGYTHTLGAPSAVIVGLDRNLTYAALKQATLFIRSGLPFIGTNPDPTFPTIEGQVPGAGAILAALEVSTGITPTIIGKPNKAMYQLALDRLNLMPEDVIVVGDRLETDIAGGINAGCHTCLVLSGVTDINQIVNTHPISPDLTYPDLYSLICDLHAA